MKVKQFLQDNSLIIVGLSLPILVMIIFMLSTIMPMTLKDPPKYDLVFSQQDYSSNNRTPLTVNFVVKDGVLNAQYTKNERNYYNNWKKLYLYDAKTKKIKQLSFGLPANYDKITGMKESVVNATQNLKLDTTLQSPDGYQLMQRCHTRSSGLFGELFFGYRNGYPCLKKGSSFVKLMGDDGKYYYSGNIQFIGWVIP